jgi:hypothetical protein
VGLRTRRELFIRLGIIDDPDIPTLHKRTIRSWSALAQKRMKEGGRFRSAFWGGMFPAGDVKHCGRAAMYGLLNLPETEPDHPKLMATSQAGKDVENQIIGIWREAGLSIAGENEDQLRLQDPRYWYSAALDDVLDLRPEVNFVVPVDVKSKKDDVINEMKVGLIEADPRHRAQVIGYIHVCRLKHNEIWGDTGLEPSRGGFVYYVSRDNPANAFAFWVPYVEDEVADALKLLSDWKEKFTSGELPERPKDWRWTEQPCKWCDFKKRCKADVKEGVTSLADSVAVAQAKEIRPEYDVQKIHARVLQRWAA